MNTKSFLLYVFPFIIYLAFLSFILLIPAPQELLEFRAPEQPSLFSYFVNDLPTDKIAHFFLFAGLTFLAARMLLHEGNDHYFSLAIIGVLAIAILLESLQLITGRIFELTDVLANMLGVLPILFFKQSLINIYAKTTYNLQKS